MKKIVLIALLAATFIYAEHPKCKKGEYLISISIPTNPKRFCVKAIHGHGGTMTFIIPLEKLVKVCPKEMVFDARKKICIRRNK